LRDAFTHNRIWPGGDIEVLESLESIASGLGGHWLQNIGSPISKYKKLKYLNTRVNNVSVVRFTPKPQMERKREAKRTDRLGFFR